MVVLLRSQCVGSLGIPWSWELNCGTTGLLASGLQQGHCFKRRCVILQHFTQYNTCIKQML